MVAAAEDQGVRIAQSRSNFSAYDGRWAAVTTHAHGGGRVTFVGTLPDHALAVALGRGGDLDPGCMGSPGVSWRAPGEENNDEGSSP